MCVVIKGYSIGTYSSNSPGWVSVWHNRAGLQVTLWDRAVSDSPGAGLEVTHQDRAGGDSLGEGCEWLIGIGLCMTHWDRTVSCEWLTGTGLSVTHRGQGWRWLTGQDYGRLTRAGLWVTVVYQAASAWAGGSSIQGGGAITASGPCSDASSTALGASCPVVPLTPHAIHWNQCQTQWNMREDFVIIAINGQLMSYLHIAVHCTFSAGYYLRGSIAPQTVEVGCHMLSVSHGLPPHRTHCMPPRTPIHSNSRPLVKKQSHHLLILISMIKSYNLIYLLQSFNRHFKFFDIFSQSIEICCFDYGCTDVSRWYIFWGFVISPYLGRDLRYRCHGLQKVLGRGTPHAVGQGCHTVSPWISVPLHKSYCMVSMVTSYPSLHQLMRRILIYSAFHEI